MDILKNFVVFEGIDGSGTTTQLNILENFFLQNRNTPPGAMKEHQIQISLPPFHKTNEPTDSCIGRLIRSCLKEGSAFDPKTTAFLFAADRNEHLYGPGGIAARCLSGQLVVSDRYLPSSLVYQGITCGNELPHRLNKDFPGPELLLFFDIDPETAQKRIAGRSNREIFEYLDFQIQVRERYLALLPVFAAQGVRVETIDASRPPEEIAREVWTAVVKMPIFKG